MLLFAPLLAGAPGNGPEVYLWDMSSGHWWYTNTSQFPYMYDFTLHAWLYYFPDTHNARHYTTNPRYFEDLATGKIITIVSGCRWFSIVLIDERTDLREACEEVMVHYRLPPELVFTCLGYECSDHYFRRHPGPDSGRLAVPDSRKSQFRPRGELCVDHHIGLQECGRAGHASECRELLDHG